MKSCNDFLNSPNLQSLMRKATELNKLNQVLNAVLPSELQGHCQVQNFTNGCLRLETDAAVWSARIRYLTPSLTKILTKTVPGLTTIDCTVRLPDPINKPATTKPIPLSTKTKHLLAHTAEAITDKRLRTALEKLSKNTESVVKK